MVGEEFQGGLHVGVDLHPMARFEEHLEALLGQLARLVGGVAGIVQRMEQDAPAQLTDAVPERRLALDQHAPDRPQRLDRKLAQARSIVAQPVAQGGFGAVDRRAGFPEGVVEVEGDQADAHVSVSCLRLARGCAWS
ncbi:hypothetical protein BAY1663_03388 [Pseudomonas sp. BAY1663]|nr:hypothetical protein BAY1663_03388 [Pseudomonas sp. BAY1663]